MSSTIITNPAIPGRRIVKLRWDDNQVTFVVDGKSYLLINQVIRAMESCGNINIEMADGLWFKVTHGHLLIRRQVEFDDDIRIDNIDPARILPELKNIEQSLKNW